MRISEYPFNPRLLVGAMMKWIPGDYSLSYQRYINGERFYYTVVAMRTNPQGKLIMTLRSKKGFQFSGYYSSMHALNITRLG
jgi:hypothetical protein